jgi:hypothetical protein
MDKLKVLEIKLQEKKDELTFAVRDRWGYVKNFVHFASANQKIMVVGIVIAVAGFGISAASESVFLSTGNSVFLNMQISGGGVIVAGGGIAAVASVCGNRSAVESKNTETQY